MKIHRHQDGYVLLRDSANKAIYTGTVDEFVGDHGSLPPLPAGMESYIYYADTKIMVYYDAFQNAFPVEGTHEDPVLQAAAANKDQLVQKMAGRVLAKEVAERARKEAIVVPPPSTIKKIPAAVL